MAEVLFDKVRFQLPHDTFENWTAKNPTLKEGELVLVIVPASAGAATTEPTVLFKVGDGTTKFNNLGWASSLAADVYDWAKADTKPTYTSSEVKAVSYEEQTLTNAQQNQARTNIGVNIMRGASDSHGPKAGLVPAPTSDEGEKFLNGNGTWSDITTDNIKAGSNVIALKSDISAFG